MALAIDASTPAIVSAANNSITTASFTPPNSSILVALLATNEGGGSDSSFTSVTNTGTGLTWTRRARKNLNAASDGGAGTDGGAEIWTAFNATSQAITVTADNGDVSGADHKSMQVVVLTGGDQTQLTHITAASSTSGLPSATLTSCVAGSHVLASASDWAQAGLGTAGSGQTIISEYDVTGQITNHHWRTTATLSGPGSQTMNLTAPSAENYNLVVIEVLATGGAAAPPPLPFAPGKTWRRRFKHPQILPTQPPPPADVVATPVTPQPIVVTGPTSPPLAAVVTVKRGTLQDDTTKPPLVLTPQPQPRPVGVTIVDRGTLQDDPVLTTAPPLVLTPQPQPRPAGVVVMARSSLIDLSTPAPIVVNPQPARPVPGSVVTGRGTLQDDPVLTTNPPVVRIGSTPLPSGGLAFTSRSSLVDVAAPTATPQPIVIVGQTQPPIQVSQAFISLGVGMADAPGTSGPITFPVVVTGQTPRPPGVSSVQRSTLIDPPVLTTPGPIVVTGTTPKPLNTPQPISSRSSLVDITAATPQPIIAIGAGGVPVAPTPYLSRSSYADVVVPVGTPSPLVVASQAKQAAASPIIIRRNSLQDDPVLTTKPAIVIAAPYLRIPTATIRVAIPASGIGVPFATTLTGNVHGPDGQILAGLAGTASGAILGDMHGPTSSGEGGTIS